MAARRRQDDEDDAFNLFGGPPASNNPSKEVIGVSEYSSLFQSTQAPPRNNDNPFELFPTQPIQRRQDLDELDELFPVAKDVGRPPAPQQLDQRQADLFPSERPRNTLDEFKKSGNAMDIIMVRHDSGTPLGCTPWHVAFSYSRFLSTGSGDRIDIFVNGNKLQTTMVLGDKGRCLFTSGTEQPDELTLAAVSSLLPMDTPPLYATMRFEHRKGNTVRFVECRLFLWHPDDAVVVADLDGTITINDVEGHIRTLRLGQYDFIHPGVCDFFTRLHRIGLRVLYLTARPINWADASREHLDNAIQNGNRLPPGPLLTNSQGVTGALLTEVVHKNPHVFKSSVLNAVQMACITGGRMSSHPLFVAGFGNRQTDVQAYSDVGIESICLLDPNSLLQAVGGPTFRSYGDPRTLLWLLPRLRECIPLHCVDILDGHHAEMVVQVEDAALADEKYKEATSLFS